MAITASLRSGVGLKVLGTLVAVGAISAAWNTWQAEADDKKPDTTLSAFMRKKLDASSKVLEGLTTEDADLVQQGANALIELSKAEKWQMLTDPEYRAYSADFRNTAKKLADAAAKGNFDNATLQWFDATKGCIECHQHVRRSRAAKE